MCGKHGIICQLIQMEVIVDMIDIITERTGIFGQKVGREIGNHLSTWENMLPVSG